MGSTEPAKNRRRVFGVFATCLPYKKNLKRTSHNQGEEGGGRLPQGNVTAMLGSQLTVSG